MKNLSDRINALSPAQRALLEKQLQQKGLHKQPPLQREEVGRIAARGHDRPSPLSYDQERLWLYSQMEPDKSTYNVYFGFRLFGEVQVAALEASLNTILQRQHAWRTTFQMQDGKPVQIVHPELTMELPIHDLTHLPEADREAAAEELKTQLMQRPFDLEQGPILRSALLRIREQEHVFLLVVHHAVTDRVSFSVFFDELTTLYRGHVTGEHVQLPELPIQYADYAEHQRTLLQGEQREKLLAYWKQHLAGSTLQLDLPTDFPRQADKSDRGAREYFQMPLALLEQVKTLARSFGMTPNMVFMAAYHALLHRYTHQPDIIVGTPLTNRDEVETERIIGYFLTMIPLRVQVTPGLTFRDLLTQVREVSLGGYAHRQLPFGMLLDELKPERDPSRNPIIQAVFVYVDVAEEPFELPGLQAVPEKMDGGTSIYDLNLGVIESAGGISLIEYNSDLFTAETIQRMIQHYLQILEAVVVDPSLSVAHLPLLTALEQQLLEEQWSTAHTFASDGLTLAQKFEAQVEKAPENVALSFAGTSWTYREVNEQANSLARVLRRQGVSAETLVGLCVERSPQLVVGLLAILKAGGAYVPLDPAYPQERLHDLVQDSGLTLVLTERKWQDMLAPAGVTCVWLDDESVCVEGEENLPSMTTPDSLAYVIYTSGSTGKPKGVLITQENVVRLFQAAEEHFAFGADDVWTLFHSFSFDFSVWEIWGALLYGGRLVIVPHDVSRTPEEFYQLLHREGVTVLNQTPSAFQQLMQAEEITGVSPELALRYVIFGGEALDVQSLQPWFARHGDQRPQMVNMYGITETTVHVTCRPLQLADAAGKSGSVIGKPLPDLQLYLLDDQMQPVPIGVRGELYVGGKGLARGYLNRPELTAERFVPHPWRADSGERLYRSGDVARRLANGDVEYLGRADNQVKIRGFRIELGEVESALRQVSGVQQAVAVVRDDRHQHRRIIGYVVVEKGISLTSGDLRHAMQKQVPEHLIPSVFVVLDQALPLTANGKIDRAALPAPELSSAERSNSFAPAQSDLEQLLVEIWRDVLNVEQIGVHDNFFELGGDSILSISITARASQKGLRLQPRDLFKYQTISDLSRVVKSLPQVDAEQGVVTGDMPLTPIQNWFLARELPEPQHWNLPLLLEVGADVHPDLLQAAANHLVAHHDALRICYLRDDHGWRQHVREVRSAAFHHIDLREVGDAELLTTLEAQGTEWQAKLNLSEGPLTQFLYFDCGRNRPGRLWLLMHHLIVDTVSWRLLMEDLETVYGQLLDGEPVALSAKTTSFKRWGEHLHEKAQEERVLRELPHWQAALQPVRPLPVDFHGENNEASIDTISLSLSAEETRALLQDVPKAYHTEINDALLTALAQTVSAWTSERSVLVHLEGHGREPMGDEIDLSRTVGFFTAMFPVRLDLQGLTGIGEELMAIKEQLRAIPNKGIGYGLLRELHTGEASHSLREMPQPEIIFNYLGRFEQGESSSGHFKMSENLMGPVCSLNGSRAHVLQVMITVADGKMEIVWEYSSQLHRRETIEQVVHNYREHLRALIAHCQNPDARGFTPSDFPTARLNQQNLNKLMDQLGKSKGGPKR